MRVEGCGNVETFIFWFNNSARWEAKFSQVNFVCLEIKFQGSFSKDVMRFTAATEFSTTMSSSEVLRKRSRELWYPAQTRNCKKPISLSSKCLTLKTFWTNNQPRLLLRHFLLFICINMMLRTRFCSLNEIMMLRQENSRQRAFSFARVKIEAERGKFRIFIYEIGNFPLFSHTKNINHTLQPFNLDLVCFSSPLSCFPPPRSQSSSESRPICGN